MEFSILMTLLLTFVTTVLTDEFWLKNLTFPSNGVPEFRNDRDGSSEVSNDIEVKNPTRRKMNSNEAVYHSVLNRNKMTGYVPIEDNVGDRQENRRDAIPSFLYPRLFNHDGILMLV